jgi:eukaryotic-like serine/threonine-protein kinase
VNTAPGAKLQDRFQIIDEIGEGGFAQVYRAKDTANNNKVVAVKVLKDAYLADPEIVERFRREVFAVASISSPHVVHLHDFGISGDEVYIAMEYAEGPTLRDVIYERTWTADEIHLVIGQIAQALASAHRQDIVHRDLKPENVMLVPSPSGTRHVKVLDFGLAKLAELERKLELEPITRVGMCFGTPQYMAPELVQGRPFDKSIDLYALGVILFEMLAGRLPWDGADAREILLRVVRNPAPRLTKAHPSIAPRLDEVNKFLARALAKDADERPEDAATFFREFEQAFFSGKPPRVASQVPAEEAVFASVWAASLTIDLRDTDVDDTLVDLEPDGAFGGGGASTRSRRKQKLRSSWIMSVVEMQTIGIDAEPVSLKDAAAAELAASAAAKKKPKPAADTDTGSTEIIDNYRKAVRGSVWVWIIPLVLAVIFCAAAVGYFVGRQGH